MMPFSDSASERQKKRFVLLVNIEFPCDIGEASGKSRGQCFQVSSPLRIEGIDT